MNVYVVLDNDFFFRDQNIKPLRRKVKKKKFDKIDHYHHYWCLLLLFFFLTLFPSLILNRLNRLLWTADMYCQSTMYRCPINRTWWSSSFFCGWKYDDQIFELLEQLDIYNHKWFFFRIRSRANFSLSFLTTDNDNDQFALIRSNNCR